MTREEIATVLKQLRLKAGLTQTEAAAALGRKQQTLASWETAQSQPDANTLFILCDIYGASVDEAFGFATKKKELNAEEQKIIDNYRQLNAEGQERAATYMDDLVASGKYKKHDKSGLGEKKHA